MKPAVQENYRAMEPVLEELAEAGFVFESLNDLIYTKVDYREALPILLRWLPKAGTADVKEIIVRALTERWARPDALRPLIEEFMKAAGSNQMELKWAIASALSVIADDSVIDEILPLVRQEGNEMMVMALGNMKDPRAVDAAISVLGIEKIAIYAIEALGKLKAERARPDIEPFLEHKNRYLRKMAKQALAKIDRAATKAAEARGRPSNRRFIN